MSKSRSNSPFNIKKHFLPNVVLVVFDRGRTVSIFVSMIGRGLFDKICGHLTEQPRANTIFLG